ncbi:flavin-containing monooxygenase [Ottowia testudinis]|uniref:Alpha/beta hydrolase fold domain-containing protein n=1 Tax=Ottowia testudinis TaxID=2816950 RepID=A0A975H6R4_9BURK|nr:alpha/beta hydrolase fold domain-containing protein [Ottowia testudinis]QTD46277.1 alpha/beta hydrolase fold domain-containing protein [Ottowia testudinis]
MPHDTTTPLTALIIGTGFGGLGMAIALRRAGIDDFLLLEKAGDVGGVWRDNDYPGAACDVPSHLYSFSFEPNSHWSRAFATQPEIHAYLRHCANKYGLLSRIRFGAEVAEARFDEAAQLWRVRLAGGDTLCARQLITAVGQLSRPALPAIEGLERFQGPAFHSSQWDHGVDLAGKQVAVIGTGASAIQFVPAIVDQVGRLNLFQRSAAYVLPRTDRAYSDAERERFARQPWRMKLQRLGVYASHELRALGFTRLPWLLRLGAEAPFRRFLRREVADPALRAQLTPDYPIGCKRILLSNNYLAAMTRPQLNLVTTPIRRVVPEGVETTDGTLHRADVLIHGTGFAATEFLAPMHIVGRAGRVLHDAWADGAQAYLGLTVPGFPNLFMLYGPNTNLGHNSIVYMLESQIAHVMRCLHALRETGASTLEVRTEPYQRYNRRIRQRLGSSAWQGCQSWYLDAQGRNTVNWPGFTLSYRALLRTVSLRAYRFTQPLPADLAGVPGERVLPSPGALEAASAATLRLFLRHAFRARIGPPQGAARQRAVVRLLTPLMPGTGGVTHQRGALGGVPVDEVRPTGDAAPGALLYLHGGAFCLGGPDSHRAISTRLARGSGLVTWVPDYRLAPEHPWPAAVDDALACWQALRAQGLAPHQIVLAGDSAGASVALALALRLKALGEPPAAGLLLISPLTDLSLGGPSMATHALDDPMIRPDWLRQAGAWYACPPDAAEHQPLHADLAGLPPLHIQAGEQEVLLSDATRLAQQALRCGLPCTLELHAQRWHVFHLQALPLASARAALERLAQTARGWIDAAGRTDAEDA